MIRFKFILFYSNQQSEMNTTSRRKKNFKAPSYSHIPWDNKTILDPEPPYMKEKTIIGHNHHAKVNSNFVDGLRSEQPEKATPRTKRGRRTSKLSKKEISPQKRRTHSIDKILSDSVGKKI